MVDPGGPGVMLSTQRFVYVPAVQDHIRAIGLTPLANSVG